MAEHRGSGSTGKPLPRKLIYQVMVTLVDRTFSFGGAQCIGQDCQAENNKKEMEIFLLNKREKVFEPYKIKPRYRDYGHSLVPVSVDEICPP